MILHGMSDDIGHLIVTTIIKSHFGIRVNAVAPGLINSRAHRSIIEKDGLGNEFLGWVDLPESIDKKGALPTSGYAGCTSSPACSAAS